MEDIYNSFAKDVKNAINIFKLSNERKTDSGCMTNFLANTVESLYQTVKMFVWDIPKGAVNFAKAGWNYFFGEEEERSTAMLASSVMSEDMAQALADWNLPEFYSLLKKNFFNFFKGIREFYGEMLGCTKWEGLPYQSQCIDKMNWSCPNCENMLSFACGLTGQLGTGFLLGGILGTAKSVASVANMKRVMGNPSKFGIVGDKLNEFKARVNLTENLDRVKSQSRQVRFRARRKTKAVRDFLSTQRDEMKFIMGIGDSFKNLVKATPVTMPYHHIFQKGQLKGYQLANELQMKHFKSSAIHLGRNRALRLDNIGKKFDDLFDEFKDLTGKNFDPVIYKELRGEFMDEIKDQLERSGVKVDISPDKTKMTISKEGQSFEYAPRFEEQLKNMPDGLTADSMKDMMKNGDVVLGSHRSISLPEDMPKFWKDFHESASTSRGMFTLKSDGTDGFTYLGHFAAQTGNVPQTEDCSGKLENVDLIRSQEINKEGDSK